MLGHILLLIFIILSILIIFSTPDSVANSTPVVITPLDEPYVEIVEKYVLDKVKLKQEAQLVKENVIRPHHGVVLGSSTGHLVNELNAIGLYTTGVDESKYMVRHAKDLFPHTYTQGEYTCSLLFPEQSLSHVLCVDYTMAFLQDKASMFRTVHQWLELGGLFFVHIPLSWDYGSRPSSTYTSMYLHNSLREKATLDKTYTITRPVYMEPKQTILAVASQYGFEVYRTVSLPFPYESYQVVVFKSVDPVYL